jgi:hypothetical protein
LVLVANYQFPFTLMIMKAYSLYLFFMYIIFVHACAPKQDAVDLAAEINTLSLLQKQEQDAHLQEQPALLVNMLHDTLMQVKNGVVSYYTKDQMTERFIKYFESVEFFKWEDTEPPVYTFSDDASMASILIRKQVILNDVTGPEPVRDTTQFAWTELWRKKEGSWKIFQVTTTDVRE